MGRTNDFFSKKHEWSKFKDKLLSNYLKPYLEKLKITNRPIRIFDCFAGKGKFDDGSIGSPLIILERIYNSNAYNCTKAYFIEEKYADILDANISEYSKVGSVLKGSYQDSINQIAQLCESSNVFLYIDPYGIKYLNYEYFESFKNGNCNTIEMLLNFNTFGFLREGNRLITSAARNSYCDDDVIEYEIDNSNSIDNMNKIANGKYWQELLHQYNNNKKDMKTIEREFAQEYNQQLKKIFKYVIDIPINDKITSIPKYRMIYGTNYDEGLFLMVDQMHKVWTDLLAITKNGQEEFFSDESECSISNMLKVFSKYDIEKELFAILEKQKNINMKAYYVKVIEKSGITYSSSEFKAIIKKMEDGNRVLIKRDEEITKTGKPSKSMDFCKHNIQILGK